jgi:hypothetical protein
MRSGAEQVGGQPVAVDEEMPQVLVIVGKRLDQRAQSGNVPIEPLGGAVDPDTLADELAELLEPMVVAVLQVAPIKGHQLCVLRLHDPVLLVRHSRVLPG